MGACAQAHPPSRAERVLPTLAIIALTVTTVFGLLNSQQVRAQSQLTAATSLPSFEVASVKPSKPGSQGGSIRREPGGRFTVTNMALRVLVAAAYLGGSSPQSSLILGGPNWIDSEHFDVEARAEGDPDIQQERLMMQSLLEDRFKLVLHPETRQLPLYALVISKPGKIGPQLILHANDGKCTDTGKPLPQPSPAEAMPAYCGGFFMSPEARKLRETGNGITMDMLSVHLIQFVNRKVVNQTGFSGLFDFNLEFAPELGPAIGSGTIGSAPDDSATTPTLFTALQDQLGLKLESTKGPVDVLVIDHVEALSPN